MTPLNELAVEAVVIREARGFTTPESLDDTDAMLAKLMLVTTEVAEAAEAVRTQDYENFEEEIADIIIRCLDIAGSTGIDLDGVVRAKLRKNRERAFQHGGKRA